MTRANLSQKILRIITVLSLCLVSRAVLSWPTMPSVTQTDPESARMIQGLTELALRSNKDNFAMTWQELSSSTQLSSTGKKGLAYQIKESPQYSGFFAFTINPSSAETQQKISALMLNWPGPEGYAMLGETNEAKKEQMKTLFGKATRIKSFVDAVNAATAQPATFEAMQAVMRDIEGSIFYIPTVSSVSGSMVPTSLVIQEIARSASPYTPYARPVARQLVEHNQTKSVGGKGIARSSTLDEGVTSRRGGRNSGRR